MLNRTTTVVTAWVIIVFAVPVVWIVGYQDHPWRQPGRAAATGLVLILAAVVNWITGTQEDPPISNLLLTVTTLVAVGAFFTALVWARFG
jgi:hypothetical protein